MPWRSALLKPVDSVKLFLTTLGLSLTEKSWITSKGNWHAISTHGDDVPCCQGGSLWCGASVFRVSAHLFALESQEANSGDWSLPMVIPNDCGMYLPVNWSSCAFPVYRLSAFTAHLAPWIVIWVEGEITVCKCIQSPVDSANWVLWYESIALSSLSKACQEEIPNPHSGQLGLHVPVVCGHCSANAHKKWYSIIFSRVFPSPLETHIFPSTFPKKEFKE